jgi:hypothetical protein
MALSLMVPETWKRVFLDPSMLANKCSYPRPVVSQPTRSALSNHRNPAGPMIAVNFSSSLRLRESKLLEIGKRCCLGR